MRKFISMTMNKKTFYRSIKHFFEFDLIEVEAEWIHFLKSMWFSNVSFFFQSKSSKRTHDKSRQEKSIEIYFNILTDSN